VPDPGQDVVDVLQPPLGDPARPLRPSRRKAVRIGERQQALQAGALHPRGRCTRGLDGIGPHEAIDAVPQLTTRALTPGCVIKASLIGPAAVPTVRHPWIFAIRPTGRIGAVN
jgi:hypothetical protein